MLLVKAPTFVFLLAVVICVNCQSQLTGIAEKCAAGDVAPFEALEASDGAAAVLDAVKDAAIRSFGGVSCLHLAAKNNRVALVALLLRLGVNPNIRTSMNRTPLHLAALHDAYDAIRLLGNASGVEIDARDVFGQTSLRIAGCNLTTIDALLALGADANVADKDFSTPLIEAAFFGCEKLVARLLDAAGANIEAATRWGETALRVAIRQRRADVVEVLLARGASLEAAKRSNRERYNFASGMRDSNIRELIEAATPPDVEDQDEGAIE